MEDTLISASRLLPMWVVGHRQAMGATLGPMSCVFSPAEAGSRDEVCTHVQPSLGGVPTFCSLFLPGLISLCLSLCVCFSFTPHAFLHQCYFELSSPQGKPGNRYLFQ